MKKLSSVSVLSAPILALTLTVILTLASVLTGCTKTANRSITSIRSLADDSSNGQTQILPENHPNPNENIVVEVNGTRIGTREYVASVFENVFGESAEVSAIIDILVVKNITIFGGSCDNYNTSKCPLTTGRARFDASETPAAYPPREGLRVRACEEITNLDSAISYVVGEHLDIPSVSTEPSEVAVRKLYSIFYPGQDPSSEVVDSLLAIATDAKQRSYPTKDSWRFIILTLCLSPDWQVP